MTSGTQASTMQGQALRLLQALVAVQRNARTHALTNAAMLAPMEALRASIEDVIAIHSQCEFHFYETVCVLNGVMATPDLPILGVVREVTAAFTEKHVGGFRLVGAASQEQCQVLVHALLEGRVGAEPRFAFEVMNVSVIVQLLHRLHEQEVATILSRDAMSRALTLYAALLRIIQKSAATARNAGQVREAVATSRVLREAVDGAMDMPEVILELAMLRDARVQYLQRHLVGTALLSILVGLELGLPRAELLHLARVALFHDLGMALYGEHLEKTRDLAPADRVLVQEMPLLSARGYLRRRGLDFETLRAVVAAIEYKRSFDDPLTPAGAHIKTLSLTTMASRIAQVCSAFDAMTSDRPFRAAVSPPVAIEALANGKTRYDPRVVIALMRVLGGVKRPVVDAARTP